MLDLAPSPAPATGAAPVFSPCQILVLLSGGIDTRLISRVFLGASLGTSLGDLLSSLLREAPWLSV